MRPRRAAGAVLAALTLPSARSRSRACRTGPRGWIRPARASSDCPPSAATDSARTSSLELGDLLPELPVVRLVWLPFSRGGQTRVALALVGLEEPSSVELLGSAGGRPSTSRPASCRISGTVMPLPMPPGRDHAPGSRPPCAGTRGTACPLTSKPLRHSVHHCALSGHGTAHPLPGSALVDTLTTEWHSASRHSNRSSKCETDGHAELFRASGAASGCCGPSRCRSTSASPRARCGTTCIRACSRRRSARLGGHARYRESDVRSLLAELEAVALCDRAPTVTLDGVAGSRHGEGTRRCRALPPGLRCGVVHRLRGFARWLLSGSRRLSRLGARLPGPGRRARPRLESIGRP